MTRTKISLLLALIFLLGAVAGAGVQSYRTPSPRPTTRPRPPEDFANHVFNRIKEKLELTPEQIEKVEPVFRKGFEEVRTIQERSLKEVGAAVKRNHEEIAELITPEQRQKLEEMDREREKSFRERRGRRHGPGGSTQGAPSPTAPSPVPAPEK